MKRRRWHRAIFLLAGLHSLGWGLYSAVYPDWLFAFIGMVPPIYPELVSWLGAGTALFGLLYLEVARVPERGWAIAAVGLLSKILAPWGWLHLMWTDQWTLGTAILSLANEQVWWIPFLLYLHDARPGRA